MSQVVEKKKGAWTIHDVRFRLLSLAVRNWQRRKTKFLLSSQVQQQWTFTLIYIAPGLLILPSVPGELFETKVRLCRTEGGSDLRWWSGG